VSLAGFVHGHCSLRVGAAARWWPGPRNGRRGSGRHYRRPENSEGAPPWSGLRLVIFEYEETSKVRKAPLLETADVAVELGLSPRTLEGWRRRGEGPPYLKVGRLVKYRPEDIEAYKAARLRANLPPSRTGVT
jgi:Helix-turn-helix domain